jgi:NAD(P)H-hydrate epimerase
MNRSGAGTIALDIPSGLHADTGCALGIAAQANLTMTFIGLKQGLFTGQGPHYCGEVHYNDLRVPPQVLMQIRPQASLLDMAAFAHRLAPRARSAHKGQFGHVLVIGGEQGMSGAVRLAGEAALRVGAGLVSVATRAAHAGLVSQARPELMAHGVESARELRGLWGKANMLAIGPGLGQGDWGKTMFGAALDSGKPLVLDADALNLLARDPVKREDWVLTPHPGEAGRLLDCSSAEIEADRIAAVRELQSRFGGSIVLKGAGSLVCSTEQPVGVCAAGNPGMASGGMGDVLTGVIAGLLAQMLKQDGGERERRISVAARLGVCLHAEAADDAARSEGERGMLASDLMPWLRAGANPTGRA